MDHLEYLFAGFAVFWAGLFGYLLWLQARLRAVTRALERVEERLAEAGDAAPERSRSPGEPSRPAAGLASSRDRGAE